MKKKKSSLLITTEMQIKTTVRCHHTPAGLCCWVTKSCLTLIYCFSAAATAAKSLQSCPSLCDPVDCSTPCSCLWLIPRVCSDSCSLSRWCYLTISSSATPFSFCFQSFPASQSFPLSQLFASGGQSTRTSHQSFQWINRVDFL